MQPDYSLPLATSLKTATEAAHETASTSQGAGWLTRGELDKEEYIRFLMMLYHVYECACVSTYVFRAFMQLTRAV